MRFSSFLIFFTTISIFFSSPVCQAAKIEHFAQTNNKNIICSMTKLTRGEATRLCKKELQRLEQEVTHPWLYISPGIKFPQNCVPLKIKITNNSPDNIYIPGRKYLGNSTMELDSPYGLKHAFLQLGLANLPIAGGLLAGAFIASKLEYSVASAVAFLLPVIVGFLVTQLETIKLADLYKQVPSKLFFKGGDFAKYVCKIDAGETFEDVIFLDKTKVNKDFFKQATFIYLRENLKEWDPEDLQIIPNDGYTYYYDQEVLDTTYMQKNLILEGFLIFKKSLARIRLNEKSTFYWNGSIYFEEDCKIELESGKIMWADETFFWDSLDTFNHHLEKCS